MIQIINNELAARCAASSSLYTAPSPMKWADVQALMKSDRVKNLCNRIAELDPQAVDYKEKKNELKMQLPIITPHAWQFVDGKRSNDSACWNGLLCIEYDNLNDAELDVFHSLAEFLNDLGEDDYENPEHIQPFEAIQLLSLSASRRGIWMLVQVENDDFGRIESTVDTIHNAIKQKFVEPDLSIDLDNKLDKATDLARCRFLPCYDYVLFDYMGETVVDQIDECAVSQVRTLYPRLIDFLKTYSITDEMRQEGNRHNAYKQYAIEAAKHCDNQVILFDWLADLGLPEGERKDMIRWAVEHRGTHSSTGVVQVPIDFEALPYPGGQVPDLIKMLVEQLPPCWRQTATLALLPALSTACGRMSYGQNKPLAFQVALYGKAGSGKTQFSCAPAQQVMDILSKDDNERRKVIEVNGKYNPSVCECPLVLGFDTSTVQLAKYLAFAKQTVLLYTDEISSSVGSDRNAFMQLQPLLRKGYDGVQHIMDFKDMDSFRGAIYPRISYLCCGTPTTMFKYFNKTATEQGSTRRTILVEHPMYGREVKEVRYEEDELAKIESEINWLSSQQGVIYEQQIEEAMIAWKEKKQEEAGQDTVKLLMVNTPADTMRRAAYLAYILSHYDDQRMGDWIAFGAWVAEYQLRSYTNRTYEEQKAEEIEQKKYESPATRVQQAQFNREMLQAMPEEFYWEDVVRYREEHNYPHNKHQMSVISRWKSDKMIIKIEDKHYRKV